MNDKENLNTSLIETVPTNDRSCCFYLFCCCLCCSSIKSDSRVYYIQKWRKYLAKETDSKYKINNPFRILTNLWAHKYVIKDLEVIRLNPNLLNTNKIRNDLEFYIPQLCSFLLFGEYEAVEEFLAFLCKACYASFYFAHRIVWFLKSLMYPTSVYNEKIKNILHIIQTIFKSENNKNVLERFHVAGSKAFIDYLSVNNYLSIYLINNESDDQNNINDKFKLSREKLDILINNTYNNIINNENILVNDFKLTHEEIYINIFKRYDSVTNDEENIKLQYIKQIDIDDINLSSFLSNINFVDHLCNICEIIREMNPQEQHRSLLNEIKKVNKILPANIYVPFLRDSIRNYIIANIPLSEVKIFKTKNRAPYMITVEAFRMEELTNYDDQDQYLVNPRKSKPKKKRKGSLKNTKSQSFVDSLLNEKIIKDDLNENKKNSSVNKTFVEKKDSFNLSKINNYLQEAEIKLSKPILIKNIYNKDNSVQNKKKKVYNILNEDIDTDVNEYKKIDEFIKGNTTMNYKSVDNTYLSGDEIVIKKKIFEEEKMLNENSKPREDFIIEESNIQIDDNIEKNDENPYSYDNSIFGEKIEDQSERLRKNSPFGNLSTYKLFKFIVKSGEDLRQEQFATQLINEFNQIFKLEKVDCWVNTYEILATGNNVGIIEVVPNAISLDQLFRKNKDYSNLANFYQNYFRSTNNYRKAIENFIRSLAGYSLVCYFLQIKDRHNANILIDDQGHIIHIDFGFMLSNAPGKGIQFEKAPFKLTKEFVDVMGGVNSKYFNKFRKLLWKGFLALVTHCEKILILVEMMYCGHGNKLPCFEKGHATLNELKSRFIPRPNMKTRDYIRHIDSLIEQSIDNWRTKWYDKYQYWVQGIFY